MRSLENPLNACLLGAGQWFRLHDHNKRSGGKPISFAAVHLKLDGADADERRLLYGVPLLSEQDSQNDDSGASHMTLPQGRHLKQKLSNVSLTFFQRTSDKA